MIGLRMFMKLSKASSLEDSTFYSQRKHGPIYRWDYEEKFARWHAARMQGSDFHSDQLCVASWKSIPRELQMQLKEHYLE